MDPDLRPAPCGIVCRTCRHANEGCAGCAAGGGDENCRLRPCARERGLAGCWACNAFPCDRVETSDPAWRGVTLGLVEAVREVGEERYRALALANIGEYAEYGHLRFKSPEEIRALVVGGPDDAQAE